MTSFALTKHSFRKAIAMLESRPNQHGAAHRQCAPSCAAGAKHSGHLSGTKRGQNHHRHLSLSSTVWPCPAAPILSHMGADLCRQLCRRQLKKVTSLSSPGMICMASSCRSKRWGRRRSTSTHAARCSPRRLRGWPCPALFPPQRMSASHAARTDPSKQIAPGPVHSEPAQIGKSLYENCGFPLLQRRVSFGYSAFFVLWGVSTNYPLYWTQNVLNWSYRKWSGGVIHAARFAEAI